MTTKRATRRPDVTIRRASDGAEISADHVTIAPKHTAGPWDLDIITDICMESNDLSEGGNQQIAEANARLIAAAPDLLATLRDLVLYPHACDSDSILAKLIQAAEAAIAKAEGSAR